MPVIFAYWNIRGLGQPVRYLLKYTNTEFEDKRYTQEGPPSYSREEWNCVKFKLGLDFPNLPYLIDGDIKITQTNAIMAHIARKNNLCGKTEADMATVDMLANVVMDFRNKFVGLCYSRNMESMKEDFIKNARTTIKTFSEYLGDKDWLLGTEITYPDFHLYEMLDAHAMLEPSLLDGMDNLKAYMERFQNLPAIKEYRASPEFIQDRVNNPIAAWSGPK